MSARQNSDLNIKAPYRPAHRNDARRAAGARSTSYGYRHGPRRAGRGHTAPPRGAGPGPMRAAISDFIKLCAGAAYYID